MAYGHVLKKFNFAVFLILLLGSNDALSADTKISVPGCDPKIYKMIKEQAEAKVAYDVARIDQTLQKPQSVLKSTCFGRAVAASAKDSGKIAAEYSDNIEQPVNAALKSFDVTDSNELASSSASGDDDCENIGDQIDKYETDKRKRLPSFDDSVDEASSSGTGGGAGGGAGGGSGSSLSGTDFKKSIDSSKSTLEQIKTNKDTLRANVNVISAAATATPDEVLSSGGTALSVSSTKPRGVNPKITKAMLIQDELRQKYDRSSATQVIDKPSSVSALSCFNKVIESYAKRSGGLFSGDYSKQVEAPVKDGLENFFSNFSWDSVIDYSASASIAASASISIGLDLGIDVSSAASAGPTIKDVECDNMNKKWEAARTSGIKKTPSFNDSVKKLMAGTSVTDEKFKKVWESDADTKDDVEELETNTTPIFTIDNPIAKGQNLCQVLTNMGISNDCSTETP